MARFKQSMVHQSAFELISNTSAHTQHTTHTHTQRSMIDVSVCGVCTCGCVTARTLL
jgi:cysteine synthase